MVAVLSTQQRNAGTYTSSWAPQSIQPGQTVMATITLDPADVTNTALQISYRVVTPNGDVLTQGEWQGGTPTKPGLVPQPPSDALVWPYPDARPVIASITTNRRIRFGVDVSLL